MQLAEGLAHSIDERVQVREDDEDAQSSTDRRQAESLGISSAQSTAVRSLP